MKKIANLILEKRYEISDSLKDGEEKKQHCIEDSTCHFIIKQILKLDKERESKSLLSKTFPLCWLKNKNNLISTY